MRHIIYICMLLVAYATIFTAALSVPKKNVQTPKNFTQEKLTEQLDSEGRYILSWEINNGNITFEIEAETLGFVGLGISPSGKMLEADIFVGGITAENVIYFDDYHGVGNSQPAIDNHKDWVLHEATENETHTYIKLSRLLNTCDDHDYPITDENTARVIWALGATDQIGYHFANRGTKSINLIAFPEPEVDIEALEKWEIKVNTTMPPEDTTYWCTIHKSPITTLNHVVGFSAVLENIEAVTHTHHFIVSKCTPPAGQDADDVFGEFVDDIGEPCYDQEPQRLPVHYFEKYLFVWAVGGKTTLFPLDAGYLVGNSSQDAYYMLEVHYDNPRMLRNVSFDTGLEIYYTPELRKYDAMLLVIGHDTAPSLLIPPNQTDFVVSGHCSAECSAEFPPAGLHVFNVLLHSHLSGRKLKLRHFRDGIELPWIAYDDSYDFDFQQNKPLREEVMIMPGDQLTYECTYDSSWANGTVVLGGLSSREEMCLTFLWAYTTEPIDLEIDVCNSVYSLETTMSEFGITNFTNNGPDGAVILEPEAYKGMRFQDFLNWNVSWTNELVQELQQKHRFDPHHAACCAHGVGCGDLNPVKYPELSSHEYKPIDPCNPASGSSDYVKSSGVIMLVIACISRLIM